MNPKYFDVNFRVEFDIKLPTYCVEIILDIAEEIAKMFFAAAGKEAVIKRAPVFLFDVLAWANKRKKNGKEAILRFSKWTLTEEMVGDTHVGEMSFKQYIFDSFKK